MTEGIPVTEFRKRDWKLGVVALTLKTAFGACVCAALGIAIPPPYFFGRATVDADGNVICGFHDKDGVIIWKSRYDTFEVLQNNMRRTADYLKLDDVERKEFLDVMNEWIQAPYTKDAKFLTWE